MPLSLADVLAAQSGAPGPAYEGGPDANVTLGGVLSALGGPWIDRARQQTERDVQAYQSGGVPELMADTQGTQELAGGFGGTTIGKPRFVHGTIADNLPSIREHGLLPGTSPYTQKFYGNDIPETLFLSGDENVQKAFSSIRGQIGQKLNKHPGDVTAQDIREHGGLVTTRDEGGYEVYQHNPEGTAQNLRGGYTEDRPPQSEPGDYFTDRDLAATGFLKGDRLVKFLENQGLLSKPQGIRAYHGSPYDFEKFDISKIGTGEGAQAYGHGLYFAENPAVAQDYKGKLTRQANVSNNPEANNALYYLQQTGFDKNAARALMEDRLGMKLPDTHSAVEAINSYNPGKMYEVNINAEPWQFLNWDLPLSQQSEAVKQAIAQHPLATRLQGNDVVRGQLSTPTGEAIVGRAGRGPEGSQSLADAGIPGIRYLDQGSRIPVRQATNELPRWLEQLPIAEGNLAKARTQGASPRDIADLEYELRRVKNGIERVGGQTQGTSNYVVFNPEIVDILKKYGLAGLTMGGVLSAAGQEPAPTQ